MRLSSVIISFFVSLFFIFSSLDLCAGFLPYFIELFELLSCLSPFTCLFSFADEESRVQWNACTHCQKAGL